MIINILGAGLSGNARRVELWENNLSFFIKIGL